MGDAGPTGIEKRSSSARTTKSSATSLRCWMGNSRTHRIFYCRRSASLTRTTPASSPPSRAYERLLVEDGLMLRYRHKDDFGDTTSAFSICSFWWAEALAMVGRLEDSIQLFHRLESHANCVGLFSEDIEPRTGRLLGNFPQAYTHVGLINTAVTISELVEARDSRFRAWS